MRKGFLNITPILAAFVIVFIAFSNSADAKRDRKKTKEVRLRLSLNYAAVNYTSSSRATNALTGFTGYVPGARLDFEGWFGRRWALIGGIDYYEGELPNLAGRKLFQGNVYAGSGLRLLGKGGPFRSEWVVAFTGSYQLFSDIRGYVGSSVFDQVRPQVFGIRPATWARINLNDKWSLQFGGYWVKQLYLKRPTGGVLDTRGSRSYGGSVLVDWRFWDGFGLGAGFYHDNHALGYRASSGPDHRQSISLINTAGSFSFRFWF